MSGNCQLVLFQMECVCRETHPLRGRDSIPLVSGKRSGGLRVTWEEKHLPVLCPLGKNCFWDLLPEVQGVEISPAGKAGHMPMLHLLDLLKWKLVRSVHMELYRWSPSVFTS